VRRDWRNVSILRWKEKYDNLENATPMTSSRRAHALAYDLAYKRLFSEPEMIRDLLVGFVHEDWVKDVDFTTLERVASQFLTEQQRERASDLIWRVQFRGHWLYLYLLLEFQSRVDPFMAVRIMTYVGLLYQDLAKQAPWQRQKRLPPVLPIVLYNGKVRWRAKQNVAELLVEDLPASLQLYIPHARYLLLDEGAIDETEGYRLKNLAAAIFRLEHSRHAEDILQVMQHFLEWLTDPDQESLKRGIATWLSEIPLKRLAPGHDIKPAATLLEAHTMLAETIDSWTRQWKKEGLQEGLELGRQKGREEGELLLLQRLLSKRFGPLPDWVVGRLQRATLAELENWGERILEARSLAEVFEASSPSSH